MARSTLALRKGMSAEYLAKAYFSKAGYSIFTPDTHESSVDFIITKEDKTYRVQVKAALTVSQGSFDLVRFRNKHGNKDKTYSVDDYDILAGVWVEESRIFLFWSKDVNETSFGEAISVCKTDGSKLSNRKRPKPFYEGII